MTETEIWRDAFERLHARVTRVCNFDASEAAAPEDERWARELDELAQFADTVAEGVESAPTGADPETARLTADAVIFGEVEGVLHVLLIRRGWPPFKGCWALPGGHVDAGEAAIEAARRELAEETGLKVGNLRPVGGYGEPGRDPRGRYVTFAYTTTLLGLPEPHAADDAVEASWFAVHDVFADPAPLAFDHGRIIHDALRITLREAADG